MHSEWQKMSDQRTDRLVSCVTWETNLPGSPSSPPNHRR